MSLFKIEMGATVKDSITGFEGVVTARAEFITGCRQYLVQPTKWKDGVFPEGCYFDEDRLLAKQSKQSKNKGGLQANTPPVK